MEIKQVTKSYGTKRVSIVGYEGRTQGEVIQFALDATGETRESLFGVRVTELEDFSGPEVVNVVVVNLDTD